ncbi:hypothetical protein J4Q44_G00243960 [Coregonus suidteri]|uniref:Uncharacterized protein n=1 Tax=Coregonus suidteri TaxID=861788 RepID=A0AAN8QN56_9TELE
MERGILIQSLLLFFTLTTVYSYPNTTLNSIQDLKDLHYLHPLPQPWLNLLYWLASNSYDMDNNNIMTLNFDPSRNDYGSHYYGNKEKVLPLLSKDTGTYYSLGNCNLPNSQQFPDYVTMPFYSSKLKKKQLENNRQRLILSVIRNHNTFWLNQVYLTQHYLPNLGRNPVYDPQNTYHISLNLLKEIHTFQNPSTTDIQTRYNIFQIPNNKNRLQFLYIMSNFTKDIYSFCYLNPRQRRRRAVSNEECDNLKIKLEVKTASKGTARISWDDIPKKYLDQHPFVVLYQNKDSEIQLGNTMVNKASGNFTTTAALNPGLQVRLHESSINCNLQKVPGEEIWRGREFHDRNRGIPVDIRGYDASLQLYVKDSKASALLYVRKSFTDWMEVFKTSWVGFYSDGNTGTSKFHAWQWAVSFSKETRFDIPEYDVYVFQSSMAMSPGVHARFIFWRQSGEKARTSYWEIQRPANINIDINGYDASLQLFVSEGYACARLYIKTSFSNWTDVFEKSWVGFYSNENTDMMDFELWQWATYFSKEIQSDIPDYDAYVYQSGQAMSAGVQARFILDSNEMARTLPWEIQRPADSKSPVDINGYDASLQLFVSEGYACARLYIKKSFSNWKNVFNKSWVGFYSNENTGTMDFELWQWATYFPKETQSDIPDYDAYVYQSSITMSPGFQARFILSGEKARTLPWKN